MENSWIDIQDETPKTDGAYDVLIEGLGDRSTRRGNVARWESTRFQLDHDKLKKHEYVVMWKHPEF